MPLQDARHPPIANLEQAVGDETREFYRQLLIEHVLDAWFPRCIDRTYGGFLCDFDRQWRPVGPDEKLLEFQARQTLTAAEALIAFPSNTALAEAVSTGFAFLYDAMWDRDYGGWFGQTDRGGRPMHSGEKHAHGTAYAIEACIAVYRATGNLSAFDLALAAFDWLDAHAHDPTYGGYFGPMRRDGKRITNSGQGRDFDQLGTSFGQKDFNVNKDLFEAFGYVCRGCPEQARVRERFDEMLWIMLRHFADPNSHPWYRRYPDWTPSSSYWSPAETAQAANNLIESRPVSGHLQNIEDAARHMFYTAYEKGRRNGAGALIEGCHGVGQITRREERNAPYWAQFELLKAAEYMKIIWPNDEKVSTIASDARNSVLHYIDKQHTGVARLRLDSLSLADRLVRRDKRDVALRKGDSWKDASHDGRCLLRLASLETKPSE